ncbi:MFS general substrate transporter [Macrolepiota fuliginosa MF-IS2]|uniref:MFS general substrate transporter n=1 Tax=Macrolepiota fuliginosa MF-IS2 TaxID=1400762 RepID=A0A9P6CA61_9AGAR|nr:MFS general substrate transporter [Macrolepiota fuliginosa MF-IS2]
METEFRNKSSGSMHDESEVPSKTTASYNVEEERELTRKYDICLLGPLALMYLCNALDKGNVGNAKTAGWDKDIGLTGNQYYILVMVFYVPFCLFGTPISLLAKRFSAARVLPIMMLGFGSMSLFSTIARGFSQVFAIRFFLGIFEAAMLPGVLFYLSTFYKRNELASRLGIFYAMSAISGAFSGLIAFGVFHIRHSKYKGWQFLFWIEGASTIIFAIFAFFWLPRSPYTWWYLNPREKEIARMRILTDSSVTADEKLSIRDSFRSLESPLYWIWAVVNLTFGVPLASVNNFLPQIVASLNYSTVKTNLFTVAPNIAGALTLVVLTFSSDYFRERSIHICIPLLIALVGFIILGTIDVVHHKGTAYFACFLLTMGAFAPSVLVATWYANNTPQESRRAAVAGIMVAIANSAGLISTNVFRAQDEPRYLPALITSAVSGAICFILVAGLGAWMRLENRRRNRAQGINIKPQDVKTENLGAGPDSPLFRFMY